MTDDEYMSRVLGMERKLYRIAHSVLWNDADCADAIQEAITKGWMKKATLREVCFFETWLVRILINECRNIQRREKLRLLPLDEGIKVQQEDDLVENLRLREALKQLPEKYRLVLLLHHLEGYDLEEIARMLGCPRTTIKSRLHQARKSLKTILQELGEGSHDEEGLG